MKHTLLDLLRQRIYGIASGYEDGNDANSLRCDPMHKLVLGKTESDPNLASQPTISRLECVFRSCVAGDSRAKWPVIPVEKSRVVQRAIAYRFDMR